VPRRLFALGGSLACGSGGGSSLAWLYDFGTDTWTQINPTYVGFNDPQSDLYGSNAYDFTTDYNAMSGEVFVRPQVEARISNVQRGWVIAPRKCSPALGQPCLHRFTQTYGEQSACVIVHVSSCHGWRGGAQHHSVRRCGGSGTRS